MPANRQISFAGVHRLLRSLFAEDLHARRILSLAGATLGAIESAARALALIGQGLALARGLLPRYAIKPVDRMLSNQGIDDDGQATIMLSLLTGLADRRHGHSEEPTQWRRVSGLGARQYPRPHSRCSSKCSVLFENEGGV